jgi:hypothetical protein
LKLFRWYFTVFTKINRYNLIRQKFQIFWMRYHHPFVTSLHSEGFSVNPFCNYLYSTPAADWDRKAPATFHTKNPKGPQNSSILYGILERPLWPTSHWHYGQSTSVLPECEITMEWLQKNSLITMHDFKPNQSYVNTKIIYSVLRTTKKLKKSKSIMKDWKSKKSLWAMGVKLALIRVRSDSLLTDTDTDPKS